MNADEARELVAGHEDGIRRVVDEAPPLTPETVAVLRAARIPTTSKAKAS